jgi:acetoin utilization deacetylase AcuC-like enzyme
MLLFTDPIYLEHQVPAGHPERPERLTAVLRHLERTGQLAELTVRTPTPAPPAALDRIHAGAYLDDLNARCPAEGLIAVDPDTHVGPLSVRAAALAAGAVAAAVQAVLDDEALRAFCAVRPPGHHAERDAAMGFCLYNSIALGAATALQRPGIERVAILDFDVHHGNGTVDIFQHDPRVLVCSSFQHPFYPNRHTDTVGPNLVHTPLPAGTGSAAFRAAIERDWLPALERHQPQLLLVSAGFDAHRSDPLAALQLDESDFAWITGLIVDSARRFAAGRIVSALEGGYDLDALARSVAAHIEVLRT